jgi:hypothetical protein
MQHPLVQWLYGDALRLLSRLPSSVIASMKQKQSIKVKTLKQARVLGFVMAQNMEFGMAGLVLDAIVTFATTISAIAETLLKKAIGMMNVLKAVIISLDETHGTRLLSIYNSSHGSKDDY